MTMREFRWLPRTWSAACAAFAATAVVLVTGAASPASAQAGGEGARQPSDTAGARSASPDPDSGRFEGRFVYRPAASDDVDAAIDETVSEMNFLIRGFAARRLRSTNEPYGRIVIRDRGDTVSVVTDDRAPIEAPADGEPIRWTREDGEELTVRMRWQEGELHQAFIAEDGRRENVYALDAGTDTLRLRVRVTSGRLPEPLTYRLVYVREEEPAG